MRSYTDPNEAWNADTVFELIKHIKEGDLCCAGTKSAASGHHGLTSKGLSPGHAYAILGSMEIDGTWCMVVEWGVGELWSCGGLWGLWSAVLWLFVVGWLGQVVWLG